jgi:PKD repeat protein
MKHISIFIMACFCALAPLQSSATGGPDAYGYTWITSLDPGGPAYSWIDITTRPGVQSIAGLADDNSAAGMINLGMSFHYYWNDYTQLKVGSNGWLSFDAVSNIASCFPTIPTPAANGDNLLAPFMGDLNFTGTGNPGQVKYWTNSIDTFIISYINVPFWTVNSPGWTGSNNFQVILCSGDSSITYQYGAVSGFSNTVGCVDMTIGIENSTGGIGLQVHSDALPPANYVIRFDYPATVLLSIQDALPRWNTNSKNAAEFVFSGMPVTLRTDIRNAGNTNITTPITLQASIIDNTSTTVMSSSGTIPTLAAGDDSVFTFTGAWSPTAGQFEFQSFLSNSQDINSANNSNSTEFEAVNPCASTINLGYVTSGAPTGSINWNGGGFDDGVAVHFVPPVYPCNISSLEYYIVSNAGNGFGARVYADDGPNGAAGTLLYTANVPSSAITVGGWNTVTLSSTVTVSSGGFYVVWLQGGTAIFIGTETNGPRSHRNYEILDNGWATYRADDQADIYVRANITGFPNTPSANFTSAYSGPLTGAFTNTSTGPVTSWLWDFGDNQTSTLEDPTHAYGSTGTYNVCLTASSACGTDSTCHSLVICIQPIASFMTTATGPGASFTDMTVGQATSWSWDFGDSQSSTQQNPTHIYTAPGTYNVCLIATNACGDSDTICQSVTVCDVTVASFAAADTGTTVSFTDQSTSAVSWEWDFGDANTSVQQNPSHFYAAAGTYTVCLITTNACNETDTMCTTIDVCDIPVAAYTSATNEDTVFVTDQSTGNIVQWLWDFGDNSTSTSQNATHEYSTGGIYTVCLTTTDLCGNVDSTCQTVFIIVTSQEEFMSAVSSMYPNPAGDELNIRFATTFTGVLQLTDALGRVVISRQLSSAVTAQLETAMLPNGLYTLLLNSEGKVSTTKVLIAH